METNIKNYPNQLCLRYLAQAVGFDDKTQYDSRDRVK